MGEGVCMINLLTHTPQQTYPCTTYMPNWTDLVISTKSTAKWTKTNRIFATHAHFRNTSLSPRTTLPHTTYIDHHTCIIAPATNRMVQKMDKTIRVLGSKSRQDLVNKGMRMAQTSMNVSNGADNKARDG
eukprot:135947_1